MLKYNFCKFRFGNYAKSYIGISIVALIVLVCLILLFPHFFRKTYKVTVTNKQIVKHDNKISKYLIYAQTEDGTVKVFEDINSSLEFKFNSEDLYWSMEINRKYEVKVYGFSIPILSLHQNIVKVKAFNLTVPTS